MSLIEKALRQLERDKQTVSLSAYSGATQPSPEAEELYEKADDAVIEHGIEEQGKLRPWRQGIIIVLAVVLGLAGAALWYMQQAGVKAPPSVAPAPQRKTAPVAAAPHSTRVLPADAVLAQQARGDENKDSSGRSITRQQPAVSAVQPQAPAPPASHVVQDDSGRPEQKSLLQAAAQRQPQPEPQEIARQGRTHPPAAASRKPGSSIKASRSAVNAGAANLLQRDSEDADSLNNRGVLLLEQGDAAQAGDCFSRALRLTPDHEKALNNMGLSLYAQGRTGEALSYYQRAVKANPGNIETYVNMGIAFRSTRDFTQAAAAFQKALALNPAHPETLYNYGLLLRDMGQQEKSRACFEQFLKIAPPRLQGVADSVRNYLQTSTVKKQ